MVFKGFDFLVFKCTGCFIDGFEILVQAWFFIIQKLIFTIRVIYLK